MNRRRLPWIAALVVVVAVAGPAAFALLRGGGEHAARWVLLLDAPRVDATARPAALLWEDGTSCWGPQVAVGTAQIGPALTRATCTSTPFAAQEFPVLKFALGPSSRVTIGDGDTTFDALKTSYRCAVACAVTAPQAAADPPVVRPLASLAMHPQARVVLAPESRAVTLSALVFVGAEPPRLQCLVDYSETCGNSTGNADRPFDGQAELN